MATKKEIEMKHQPSNQKLKEVWVPQVTNGKYQKELWWPKVVEKGSRKSWKLRMSWQEWWTTRWSGCISQVERYFVVNQLGKRKKVLAATICMDGLALAWLQQVELTNPIID